MDEKTKEVVQELEARIEQLEEWREKILQACANIEVTAN